MLPGQVNYSVSVSQLVSKYNSIHWHILLGIGENEYGLWEYSAHSRHGYIITSHLFYNPSLFWEDSFQMVTRLWRLSMDTSGTWSVGLTPDYSINPITGWNVVTRSFLYWFPTQRVYSLFWGRSAKGFYNGWDYLTVFLFKFPNVNCSYPKGKSTFGWIAILPFSLKKVDWLTGQRCIKQAFCNISSVVCPIASENQGYLTILMCACMCVCMV